MTVTPVEGFGFFYDGQFVAVGDPKPEPIPPFRTEHPWRHPYHENSFWNTPVGSGATYVSTGASQHTSTISGSSVNLNFANWADPVYLATSSDPTFTVEHRSVLPTGWNTLTNSQTGGRTGQGTLSKQYEGIHIPSNATWQSTTNTDRKVVVIQPDITFQGTFYPAGTLAIEMHKFYRVTGGGYIITTNLSYSDLRGYGMGYGAIASGVAVTQGQIRRWEIDAAAAGDVTAIRHALRIGLPNSKLKVGQIWPASHQDGDAASLYTGQTPMGSMIVLNKDTNVAELTLSGTTAVQNMARAIAWTLQNFGAYVLIRAGSGPITFAIEATPTHLNSTTMESVRSNIQSVLVPHMRIVSNSNDVGTLHNGGVLHRTPVDPSRIAGGGTRNESLRPLPINPTGPYVEA